LTRQRTAYRRQKAKIIGQEVFLDKNLPLATSLSNFFGSYLKMWRVVFYSITKQQKNACQNSLSYKRAKNHKGNTLFSLTNAQNKSK
jgi:hypothetical protein